jgi:protein ImuB
MSKLYACIISEDAKRDGDALARIAHEFAYSIQRIADGILFDVSGLQRLMGSQAQVTQKILAKLKEYNISAQLAVAEKVETAILLARQNKGANHIAARSESFQKLPLRDLPIDNDTLNIFSDLGLKRVEDLRQIGTDELIRRYGRQFRDVIDVLEQKGGQMLTPNIKENQVSWAYDLDNPVEDFEQLIFISNHGLDKLLGEVEHHGYSTEQLDISLGLRDKTTRTYEIKTSFPTLEKTFWLKLINLRIALDPPESGIMSVKIISYFTRPRPLQAGLYAVSRPDPEALLLTVNKLKKLAGEENVGVPVLVDQRLNREFRLDAEALPAGKERVEIKTDKGIIAFSYFTPPVEAEVKVERQRLVYLKTADLRGYVKEYSGVWRRNSRWWSKGWRSEEWDVELENGGVYRLSKAGRRWFLTGEYD